MTRRDEWFGTVTGDVAFDPTLKPSAKTVYLVLVMYRNAETNECFPSNETIASHTGMSTRSVIRALVELEEAGVVQREARYRDGRQTTSLTILTDARARRHGGNHG